MNNMERRIRLAREDAQKLFTRIQQDLGDSILGQELSALASNIDIALDLNDDESNDWKLKNEN
jgi:hypothetical protein